MLAIAVWRFDEFLESASREAISYQITLLNHYQTGPVMIDFRKEI